MASDAQCRPLPNDWVNGSLVASVRHIVARSASAAKSAAYQCIKQSEIELC